MFPSNSKEYRKKYRQSNKATIAESSKKYYNKNKLRIIEDQKIYSMKKKYNLTPDDYATLVAKQDFKCGICERHISELSKPLFVDHNHTTNEVRGLLCVRCNSALGAFGDNIEGLEKALKYLSDKED